MKRRCVILGAVFLVAFSQSAFSGVADFIKRGFAHCTGYCEADKINCSKSQDKQGYYTWCKKNCTYEDKSNRENFTRAIELCEKNKYQGEVTAVNVKISDGRIYHTVRVSSISRGLYILITPATPLSIKNLKKGDIVYFNEYEIKDTSTPEEREEYSRQLAGGHRPDSELRVDYYIKGTIEKG
jgi:hypothetical protein